MIRGVVPQADEKGGAEEKGKTGIEKVRSPSHQPFSFSFPNRNDAITCQNVIPIHCEPVFSGQDIALYGSRSPHKMTLVLLPFCHFHIFIIIVCHYHHLFHSERTGTCLCLLCCQLCGANIEQIADNILPGCPCVSFSLSLCALFISCLCFSPSFPFFRFRVWFSIVLPPRSSQATEYTETPMTPKERKNE